MEDVFCIFTEPLVKVVINSTSYSWLVAASLVWQLLKIQDVVPVHVALIFRFFNYY